MLESNLFATVRDLSKAEKINEAYLCRVLRLTLLSPKVTEAILARRLPDTVNPAKLLKPFPIEWERRNLRGIVPVDRDARRLPLEHVPGRLGRHVTRCDAGPAGGEDEPRRSCEQRRRAREGKGTRCLNPKPL